jgi:hypothetical protein
VSARQLPHLPRLLASLATLAVTAVTAALLSAGSTADAASATTNARDADLTVYKYGISVRRESNVYAKLSALPVSYRQAVRTWLDDAYTAAGADEACSNSPRLTVNSYHRAGFVRSSQGVYPATGEPSSCAQGGYQAIWSNRGGYWHEVIRGQEAPTCRQLSYHRVPRSMIDKCVDGKGRLVTY